LSFSAIAKKLFEEVIMLSRYLAMLLNTLLLICR